MDQPRTTIFHIREGMDVYDNSGEKIGSIDGVQFGDEDPLDPGTETVTGSYAPQTETPLWFQEFAEALTGGTEMPEAVRSRLLRYGYIRINKGIFQGDRYVTLDQVRAIDSNGVYLNINRDETIQY